MRRTDGKGRRTRDRILEAALREASLHGLESLTIGALAARLGLSKSGLFAHFGSKEALQQAALERIAEDFFSDVVRPAQSAPEGGARLSVLMANWIAWSRDPARPGGCSMASAAFEYDAKPGPLRDAVARLFRDWRAYLAQTARRAQAVDLNPAVDPERLADDMIALYFQQHMATRLLDDAEAGARALARLDRLIAGAP